MREILTRCTRMEQVFEIGVKETGQNLYNYIIINNLKNLNAEGTKIPYVPFGAVWAVTSLLN